MFYFGKNHSQMPYLDLIQLIRSMDVTPGDLRKMACQLEKERKIIERTAKEQRKEQIKKDFLKLIENRKK